MTVSFMVSGIPAPQGSKIRTRYGMRESSQRVKPWREAVVAAASKETPLEPPYDVKVFFFIPRPKKTDAIYPVAPAVGDLDKLVRATFDGLTISGIITDDRHVVATEASKEWAGVSGDASPRINAPGAVIVIKSLAAGA